MTKINYKIMYRYCTAENRSVHAPVDITTTATLPTTTATFTTTTLVPTTTRTACTTGPTGMTCQNGGTTVGEIGNCACQCVDGYSGDHCEISPLEQILKVREPSAGIIWEGGTPQIIEWSSQNVAPSATFKISIAHQNFRTGRHPSTVIANVSAESSSRFVFQVPKDGLGGCNMYNIFLEAMDGTKVIAHDTSPPFWIKPTPAILSVAIDLDILYHEKEANIDVNVSCTVQSVKIIIKAGDVLASNINVPLGTTMEGGNFRVKWTVPAKLQPGRNYSIVVADAGGRAQFRLGGLTISESPSLQVTVPAKTWRVGEPVIILWSWKGTVEYVKVELHQNGKLFQIIGEKIPAHYGRVEYNVTKPNKEYSVKVTYWSGAGPGEESAKSSTFSISNASEPFKIHSLRVLQECCEKGSYCDIIWSASNEDARSGAFEILYTQEGAQKPKQIDSKATAQTLQVLPLNYRYSWDIPSTQPSGLYTIMVKMGNVTTVTRDFVHVNGPGGVNITKPLFWRHNMPAMVQWETTGCLGTSNFQATIELFHQTGKYIATLGENTTQLKAGPGSKAVGQISPDWSSDMLYTIRIRKIGRATFWSSEDFRIHAARKLTLVLPQGKGNSSKVGDEIQIEWKSSGGIASVDIELLKDGIFYKSVAKQWPNSKFFYLSTSTYTASDSYQIRLSASGAGESVDDTSPVFSLDLAQLQVDITRPAETKIYKAGETIDIMWRSNQGQAQGTFLGYVDIDLCSVEDSLHCLYVAKKVRNIQTGTNQLNTHTDYTIPVTLDFRKKMRVGFKICINATRVREYGAVGEADKSFCGQLFQIVLPARLRVTGVRSGRIGESADIEWTFSGEYIDSVEILLRKNASSEYSKFVIASNVANTGETRVFIPNSENIEPLVNYNLYIKSDLPYSEAMYPETIFFLPQSLSNNIIVSPTALTILPLSGEINVQWQTSVENVSVIIFIEQYSPSGPMKSWKLGEDHRNSRDFSTHLPATLGAAVRNAVRIDICAKGKVDSVRDRLYSVRSEEFSITPPMPSLEIGNILGSTSDSSTFQKLVPGVVHPFHWKSSGNLGVVTLELWRCDVVPLCGSPTFELVVEVVNTTKFQNLTVYRGETKYMPPWTVPPHNDHSYKFVARSQTYPGKFFAMSQHHIISLANRCLKDCNNVKLTLIVKSPAVGGEVKKGALSPIRWGFIVENKNYFTAYKYVTITLWQQINPCGDLCSGDCCEVLISVIASEAPNTGLFNWAINPSVPNGNKYFIKVHTISVNPNTLAKTPQCPDTETKVKGCRGGNFTIANGLNAQTIENSVQSTLEQQSIWGTATQTTEYSKWKLVGANQNPHDGIVTVHQNFRLSWNSTEPNFSTLTIEIVQTNGEEGIAANHVLFEDAAVAGEELFKFPLQIMKSDGLEKSKHRQFYIHFLSKSRESVGKSIEFSVVLERALQMRPRANVVRGSTFNLPWDIPPTPFIFKAQLIKRKSFSLPEHRGRQLAGKEGAGWQSQRGIPCLPFFWEGQLRLQCVSGLSPLRNLNGKSWCATSVNNGVDKIPTEIDLCPETTDFGSLSSSAYVDSDSGYIRWSLPADELPGAGGHYYVQIVDSVTGSLITRSNEFSIACAPIEIRFTSSDPSMTGDDYERSINNVTKLEPGSVQFIRAIRASEKKANVMVWLTTKGKETTEMTLCPLQNLQRIEALPFVNGSIEYESLDMYSEPVPTILRPLISTSPDNYMWFIIGILFGMTVLSAAIFWSWRLHLKRGRVSKSFGKWKAARVSSKRKYFVNKRTGETSWRPPKHTKIKKLTSVIEMVRNPLQNAQPSKESRRNSQLDLLDQIQSKRLSVVQKTLPTGWNVDKTDDDEVFYWHDDGVTTSWDFPDYIPDGWVGENDSEPHQYSEEDDEDEELGLLPGWNVTVSDSGSVYYWHDDMESTSWDLPDWIPEGWEIPTDYFVGAEPQGELPQGWEEAEAEGEVYYFNEETNEVSWEVPKSGKGAMEAASEQVGVKAPSNSSPWKMVKTEDGDTYYHNEETDETAWDVVDES